MTEMTVSQPRAAADARAEAQKARIRARYRAETRFKAYGIAAIAFAAIALVVLVADIVVKAWPAFTIHEAVYTVTVTAEDVDPNGTKDPEVIATGDFTAPIRRALLEDFPDVAGKRALRLKLYGLVSTGASDQLRARIVAEPGLIGKPVEMPVLLSDDADLALKGVVTRFSRDAGRGTLTPVIDGDTVTLTSSTADFADDLARVKQAMADEARRLRNRVAIYKSALVETSANLADTESLLKTATAANADTVPTLTGQVAKLTSDRDSLSGQVETLSAQATALEKRFDATTGAEELDGTTPSLFVQVNGGVVRVTELGPDHVTGTALIPLAADTPAAPGAWSIELLTVPEGSRKVSDQEIAWLQVMETKGRVVSGFNWHFFTMGDSREAELAGVAGALVGSAYTMLVTLALCLPIGVLAAIYLEEFAPKNRLTELIEVNINNLAAVPSIVFGLLGLAVFLNFFGLPRSSPLVGGLVLALLVLPTIIIASRAALKAVPPSIREAALGVGASHQQAVFHHVLPLAMPGIMTGTIIGMAHALGETAPLLLIGMIAFIVDIPGGVTQAATVLPVQIYLWSDLPEIGFQAKTSAAIIVLLMFLFVMNGLAILLRKRFERRW